MSEPTFHAKLLSHYQYVSKPGTYYVSTAYTVNDNHLFMGDEHPRYIVPLRAITGDGLAFIIQALKEEASGEVPFSIIRHCFLSGAIFLKDDFDEKTLPVKGEKLLATFDYVEREEGNRLLCTSIELLPREELDYVDIEQFDQFRLAITNLITKA
jgi:hypothetical protein